MKELNGELRVAGDGTFRLYDAATGRHSVLKESDRTGVSPQETADGRWLWTVRVRDEADIVESDLTEQQWSELFDSPAELRGDPPSYRNTWCDTCPSTAGAAGGVCGDG